MAYIKYAVMGSIHSQLTTYLCQDLRYASVLPEEPFFFNVISFIIFTLSNDIIVTHFLYGKPIWFLHFIFLCISCGKGFVVISIPHNQRSKYLMLGKVDKSTMQIMLILCHVNI